MSDKPDCNLEKLDIDLVGASTRSAGSSRLTGGRAGERIWTTISSEVPETGRAALRAELEAVLAELRSSEGTQTDPAQPIDERASKADRGADDRRSGRRRRSRPRSLHTAVHEEATVPPRDDATVELEVVAVARRRGPRHPPVSATSATTRSSARSPAAAWASSSRPGR